MSRRSWRSAPDLTKTPARRAYSTATACKHDDRPRRRRGDANSRYPRLVGPDRGRVIARDNCSKQVQVHVASDLCDRRSPTWHRLGRLAVTNGSSFHRLCRRTHIDLAASAWTIIHPTQLTGYPARKPRIPITLGMCPAHVRMTPRHDCRASQSWYGQTRDPCRDNGRPHAAWVVQQQKSRTTSTTDTTWRWESRQSVGVGAISLSVRDGHLWAVGERRQHSDGPIVQIKARSPSRCKYELLRQTS